VDVGHKMHELASKIIENRNVELLEKHDYERKKIDDPKGCPHYEQNTKCHNMEDLNCYFCFCPKYDRSVKEGGCKINSPEGKYVEGLDGKIFDCSDCNFPHIKENAVKLLENLFK
jgi:Zn-finger protein